MPHNIEKSAFRRGEYVGYGKLGPYRIRRIGNNWVAHSANMRVSESGTITRRTLAEIGAALI
jgi:hypothetical protein